MVASCINCPSGDACAIGAALGRAPFGGGERRQQRQPLVFEWPVGA
jgi:hypothetical protein